jgi:fructosamine-3-kinase
MLPDDLREDLARLLGAPITRATRVGGGMINETAIVESTAGRVFVKWRADAPEGFYAAEAAGLDLLHRQSRFRVPSVIGYRDGDLPYLALEYVEEKPASNNGRFARNFAEALAETHRSALAPDGTFGLDRDNFIGLMLQRNAASIPVRSWPEFYRDFRLIPQIELARAAGLLSNRRERLLNEVLDIVADVLDGYPQSPSLLHGDLWSGNYLTVGDSAALVDPAVYYGDREVEIAFIELFGGFPAGFVQTYSSIYPLDSGYPRRRKLLQLCPLLVHLNTFGETYGQAVESACLEYVSR